MRELLHNHDRVDPEHSELVVQNVFHFLHVPGPIGNDLPQLAARILLIEVDCSMGRPVIKRREIPQQLQGACRTHRVADKALRVIDRHRGAVAEHLFDRLAFLNIPLLGRSRMSADNVDLVGTDPRAGEGQTHALSLPTGIGEDVIAGIAVHRVPDDLGIDVRPLIDRVTQSLQDADRSPFGDDDPIVCLPAIRPDCAIFHAPCARTSSVATWTACGALVMATVSRASSARRNSPNAA